MPQSYSVKERILTSPGLKNNTVTTVGISAACFLFVYLISTMPADSRGMVSKIYMIAVWAFVISSSVFGFIAYRGRDFKLLFDDEKKTFTYKNETYRLSSSTVTFSRYVMTIAGNKNSSGTVVNISDNGKELKLCFYNSVLGIENYNDDESQYDKIYLSDGELLNKVVETVKNNHISVSTKQEGIHVEVTRKKSIFLWYIVSLSSIILVSLLSIAGLDIMLMLLIVFILGTVFSVYYFLYSSKLLIISVKNSFITLAMQNGEEIVSCPVNELKVELYQIKMPTRTLGYTKHLGIKMNFGNKKKLKIFIVEQSEIKGDYEGEKVSACFSAISVNTNFIQIKPLLKYFKLDSFVELI